MRCEIELTHGRMAILEYPKNINAQDCLILMRVISKISNSGYLKALEGVAESAAELRNKKVIIP